MPLSAGNPGCLRISEFHSASHSVGLLIWRQRESKGKPIYGVLSEVDEEGEESGPEQGHRVGMVTLSLGQAVEQKGRSPSQGPLVGRTFPERPVFFEVRRQGQVGSFMSEEADKWYLGPQHL